MDRSGEERRPATVPADASGVLGDDDAFGRALARWASEATVDEAARSRARERWLRIQAAEDGSFAGALVDLAERARPVLLHVGSHQVRGLLAGVGSDFVALRTDGGQHVLVPTAGIDAVHAEPGSAGVTGGRRATLDVSLAGVLGPVAAERPEVLVRTGGDAAVRGELRWVGTDVLGLRRTGEPSTPVWVPLGAVRLIVLGPG